MADISNNDLMKLINRVIQKVDIIEEKLDKLLEEKDKTPKCEVDEEFEEISFSFKYALIRNAEELHLISTKIKQNKKYRSELVSQSLSLIEKCHII